MRAVFGASTGDVSGKDARAHQRPEAVTLVPAEAKSLGLVVASPHSGRFYPEEMLAAARLDAFALRRSEDAFVDMLFADAPGLGADLIVNNYARAYVDVNRGDTELDPLLIDELPYQIAQKVSERVKAGLGVIPRSVGDGMTIYHGPISLGAAQARLNEVYWPWHTAIETQMRAAKARCGVAVLVDCHSMPSAACADPSLDFVVGDRFGASCAPVLTQEAIRFLRTEGFQVGRNDPFAGGFATARHSDVSNGFHALQIEINRSLYMVEGALTPRPGFDTIKGSLTGLIDHLIGVTQTLAMPRLYSV
jgi:N-formylglutamate amidohydrolase